MVGDSPGEVAVNSRTNKIYVANFESGTVSVIDSNSGSSTKNIRVETEPTSIAVDEIHNKIYVANEGSNTVSVIDGYNDSQIRALTVGQSPSFIALTSPQLEAGKIYVANSGNNTVSVIDSTNSKKEPNDIVVGKHPFYIAVDDSLNKIYVANEGSNTVSVIDGHNNTKIKDIDIESLAFSIAQDNDKIYVANFESGTISVIDGHNNTKIKDISLDEKGPTYMVFSGANMYVANRGSNTVSVIDEHNNTKIKDIAVVQPGYMALMGAGSNTPKIYVANEGSRHTVSVIDVQNNTKIKDIVVGQSPQYIAASAFDMIYVANEGSNTVSVIDGFSDKVVVGEIFNVYPANSGKIICDKGEESPTKTYMYMEVGTKCTAQSKDFQFSGWVENLNRNSTIPLRSDSSGNLTVNRYGTFTANFKPLPPAIPQDFLYLLVGIILSSLFGWSIPSIAGWYKARKQLEHLEECINQIGKLDKNAIENKIKGYYVHGKISEDHRQFLKDKISEYYEKVKDS
jgi:YVTN family beta-propeller protein